MPTVKTACALLKKVIYFSDGAASQYKNCKNFSNLCYHEKDFGVKAEWHFLRPQMVSQLVMKLTALLREAAIRDDSQNVFGRIITSKINFITAIGCFVVFLAVSLSGNKNVYFIL